MLIAAILAVLSLVGLIFTIVSGLLTSGVDGLFLLLVCLLTGTIFGLHAFASAVQAGYLPGPACFRKAHK